MYENTDDYTYDYANDYANTYDFCYVNNPSACSEATPSSRFPGVSWRSCSMGPPSHSPQGPPGYMLPAPPVPYYYWRPPPPPLPYWMRPSPPSPPSLPVEGHVCEPSRTTRQFERCAPVTVFCYTSYECYALDSDRITVPCGHKRSSGYVWPLGCATGSMCSSCTVIGSSCSCSV